MPNAFWVARETILWLPDEGSNLSSITLHHDPSAMMFVTSEGLTGGEKIELTRSTPAPASISEKFPHLANLPRWTTFLRSDQARAMLRGQLAVAAYRDNRLIDVASVQCAGVLDDLCRFDGLLGVRFVDAAPQLALWAPTARSVDLLLYSSSGDLEPVRRQPMSFAAESGVWSTTLTREERNLFYLYEVEVYVPTTGRFARNLVTDPYSVSVGLNSSKSQLADLSEPSYKPPGWDLLTKPSLTRLEDSVIYELHVRDFSAADESVPEGLRRSYGAFSCDSDGTRHLARLAKAGLTHVQLLPINDFATADEETRKYNWGYDPLHWMAAEGSYSIAADGATRTLEVREMIAALAGLGLRVVLDVVFNHTYASGQDSLSLLDRVVPRYYHRLDQDGNVLTSSCCPNTASEHLMVEKMIVDSVVFWAREYKVDGFRFDLMGHLMKRTVLRLRDALRSLTLAADGVDGSRLLLYGEGWDFAEVAESARGVNATQHNMAGTGIGTFNDRLRDGVRGGNAFGDPLVPGFVTGLADDTSPRSRSHERRIEAGLAGNLRLFPLLSDQGEERRAFELDRIGYAEQPIETVNYVAAHDNETLFDVIQLKAPQSWTPDDRLRMNNMALSIVALAQGLPFFHAGDELLRSKCGDRNSYVSGDEFNQIDFSLTGNQWGRSLPPERDNRLLWPHLEQLFRNRNTYVESAHIRRAVEHFEEMLQLRRQTSLFRLGNAEQVLKNVQFLERGLLGVVTMKIADAASSCLVIFNARSEPLLRTIPGLEPLILHPLLQRSTDEVVRTASCRESTVRVPPRTTALFVSS